MTCCLFRDDVRRGIIGFYMGALRWDSEDARACIENRFRILARFFKFNPDEPVRGDNLARSPACS